MRTIDGGSAKDRWALVVAAVAYVWFYNGANYIAFRLGAAHLPPLVFATMRFGAATTILAPLLLRRLSQSGRPPWRHCLSAMVVGLLLLGYCQSATMAAARHLSASVSSLLAASSPIFLALFSWLFLRQRMSRMEVLGIALGFSGVALTAFGSAADDHVAPSGILLMLSAAATWAGGALLARRLDQPKDPVVGLGIQITTATGLLLALLCWSGEWSQFTFAAVPKMAWVSVAFLSVASTLVGYAVFLWLNRATTVVLANSFLYAAPVIATVLAAFLLGESVSGLKIVAEIVTLSGVALMVWSTGRPMRSDV